MHRRCSDWRARYRTQKTGRRMKYSSVPTSTSPFYFFIYIFFFILQNKNPWAHFHVQVIIIATLLLCMNHPVWCIWRLQQNQQPPLGFFTKSNSSFRVLLRKVMDHYRVRCPSIFSHIQAICLCVCCITTNEKTVFYSNCIIITTVTAAASHYTLI